jgi:post-segregation antitoxin (ccd killing protein)
VGMSKVSVTIEDEVLETARRESGGNLSAYVNDALKRYGRRQAMRRIVEEYEAEHGEITEAELEEARRKWLD